MSGYVLGKDADLDLDEIWEYIAADNVDAADRWIAKLFDAFEALALNPGWVANRSRVHPCCVAMLGNFGGNPHRIVSVGVFC